MKSVPIIMLKVEKNFFTETHVLCICTTTYTNITTHSTTVRGGIAADLNLNGMVRAMMDFTQ